MASGEELDSGMASQNEDCSPNKSAIEGPPGACGTNAADPDGGPGQSAIQSGFGAGGFGDEPDETLMERLWGLTEMFPEPVRNVSGAISDLTGSCAKGLYSISRSALWIFFSSSIILFAPILMECERVQVEDMQRNQQKQMLLGPNTAVSGGMPMMPPMSR